MHALYFLIFLGLVLCSSTKDIDEEVAKNFLESGERTPEELKMVKRSLRELNDMSSKTLFRKNRKRNLVLFSHDEEPTFSAPSTKDPSNEEDINRYLPVKDYLYQGDIALTAPQVQKRSKFRLRRAAIHDSQWPDTKWKKTENIVNVPFFFDPNLPTRTRTKVMEAMGFWEKHTCVRFVQDHRSEPRLRIFKGSGCWSYVGRQTAMKTQDLSYGENCDSHFGVLTHELMHALGFYHEQARQDRDDYVDIDLSNIDPNNTNQFTKEKDQDTFQLPYEYGSVMHYASNLYAKDDSKPVLKAKDPKYSTTMGQRMKPSFQDIMEVNELYECWRECEGSGTECGNGGRANVNNCKECFCPYGFSGPYCFDLERPTSKNPDCGAVLKAEVGVWKKLSGEVTAGQTTQTDFLGLPESCWWHIKAPQEDKKVAVKVTSLGTSDCSAACSFSHLELKPGNFKQTGYRLCCAEQTNVVYNSTGKTMAVGVNVRIYSTTFELEYIAY